MLMHGLTLSIAPLLTDFHAWIIEYAPESGLCDAAHIRAS
jgi:hypothetical protein